MSKHATSNDTSAAVDRFMDVLDHPCKQEVQALRELILSVSPAIAEGVKWNAPSYRTSEYFATTHLRTRSGIGLVLHLGAKVRPEHVTIEDPMGLLDWLGPNRAQVHLASMAALHERAPALRQILAQWIQYV